MPSRTLRGDRVRVKERFVKEMRGLYPALTKDTVFEVLGEVGAYEKRTLTVKAVDGAEALPQMLFSGTVVRAWESPTEREKALRAAGHSW